MRYPYFDNAKALLIFLVVFGHFIVQQGNAGEDVYWLIYSFHMPAFIFIAGYFTKKETWKTTITSSIGQFLLPYLIFQSLYNFYNYYFFDIKINTHFAYANFALWFLLAMIYWKVTMQIIVRWKWTIFPFLLLYATHRFFLPDLNYLDLGRAITFSLFFYLGHFAKGWTPKILTITERFKHRALYFPLFGLFGLLTATIMQKIEWLPITKGWFYGTFDSFSSLLETKTATELLLYQLGTTLLSLLMVLFFLLIVPTKEYTWTSIGGATLSVYLLHGFVRNIFVHKELLFQTDTWAQVVSLAAFSLFLVYVLSRKPFHSTVTFLSDLTKKKQN